jgi:hypothetical protein
MTVATASTPRAAAGAPGGRLSYVTLLEHWRDEADAVHVYTALAPRMSTADERQVLEEIAREEARHRDYFAGLCHIEFRLVASAAPTTPEPDRG